MKAIRVHEFGGPEVLRLEETATPAPGPGQVLVRIHAVGVNPVETYQRSGSNPALKLPWTPGMDGAGERRALAFIERLWQYDHIVFDASRAA